MKKLKWILIVLGFFFSMGAGYYISALFVEGEKNTIFTISERYYYVLEHPFENYFSKFTIIFVMMAVIAYFIAVLMLLFQKPTRPGQEQGSSEWENPVRITKLLADNSKSSEDIENVIVYKKRDIFLVSYIFRKIRNVWMAIKYRKAD